MLGLTDPGAEVGLERAAGIGILSTQKGTAHTAGDAVVVGGRFQLVSDFLGIGMVGAPWRAWVSAPFFYCRP